MSVKAIDPLPAERTARHALRVILRGEAARAFARAAVRVIAGALRASKAILESRDQRELLATLQRLRDLGNTVIVVEHDEDAIRLADHVVACDPRLARVELHDGRHRLHRYDLATGAKQLVFDTPGLWSIADHRGDTWLLARALGNTQIEIYQYEVATKKLCAMLRRGLPSGRNAATSCRART